MIFFATNGPGPHKCFYCYEIVLAPWEDESTHHELSMHIHHIDGDHSNNTPSNLAVVHAKCHNQIHKRRKKISESHKEKLHKGIRSWWSNKSTEERSEWVKTHMIPNSILTRTNMDPEERKQKYGQNRGKKFSAEARQNMSESMKVRWANGTFSRRPRRKRDEQGKLT